MVGLNPSDLEKLARKFPLSEATRRRNKVGSVGTSAANPKPVEGVPLVSVHKGEKKSGAGIATSPSGSLCRIRITVFSQRPADSDAHHVKEIIDCLVLLGILDDDDWKHVESTTTASKKVHTVQEERTEVEVIPV